MNCRSINDVLLPFSVGAFSFYFVSVEFNRAFFFSLFVCLNVSAKILAVTAVLVLNCLGSAACQYDPSQPYLPEESVCQDPRKCIGREVSKGRHVIENVCFVSSPLQGLCV